MEETPKPRPVRRDASAPIGAWQWMASVFRTTVVTGAPETVEG